MHGQGQCTLYAPACCGFFALYSKYLYATHTHRFISNKIISAQGYYHSWYNVQIYILNVL